MANLAIIKILEERINSNSKSDSQISEIHVVEAHVQGLVPSFHFTLNKIIHQVKKSGLWLNRAGFSLNGL